MPITVAKPTAGVVPTWASAGGATRVEPSAGQKVTGWTSGQRPAFSMMNWLQGVITDWLQYFETATDELDAEKIDADGSVTMKGNLVPDANDTRNLGGAGARWGNITTNRLDVVTDVGTPLVPFSNGEDLGSATRAWDAHLRNVTGYGTVIPDTTGLNFGSTTARWDAFLDEVRVYGDLFPDADDSATIELGTAALRWRAKLTRVEMTDITWGAPLVAAEASSTPHLNQLVRLNTLKAWACIRVRSDGGGTLSISVIDGFNVYDPNIVSAAAGIISIAWAQPMADANYAVVANGEEVSLDWHPRTTNKTTALVELVALDPTGAAFDLDSLGNNVDRFVSIHVFGRQA